jgi:hypothetical protein
MEPYRKTIGIYTFGRLMLENGDSATFEIDDLLPTIAGRDDSDNFRTLAFQTADQKRKQGFRDEWISQPADLMFYTSVGGRLIGDFLFHNRSRQGIRVEGRTTPDANFWPKVVFEVANADGNWHRIGKSENAGIVRTLEIASGKSEAMRVLLTIYKPLVGKFKYARIVFSNGQAGVFSLDLLDPNKITGLLTSGMSTE